MRSTTQFVVMEPLSLEPVAKPTPVPETALPRPAFHARLRLALAAVLNARRRRPQILYLDRMSRHLQRDIGLSP